MTEQIKGGVSKTGDAIKGKSTESIKAGAAGAATSVSTGLGKAGHSVASAFGNAYEAAKKKLKPNDAATLDKALKANKGEVRAVTVAAGSGTAPFPALFYFLLSPGVALSAFASFLFGCSMLDVDRTKPS